MKRVIISVLILSVCLIVHTAISQEAISVNAVGYVKVVSKAGSLSIIATPCNPAGTGTNQSAFTLDELIGTNMTANWSDAAADEIYVWTGSKYEAAFLNDNGWGDTNVNWKWCYMDGGWPAPCANTSIYDVAVGQGFWIRNRNTDKTLYLVGEVPAAATNTTQIGGLLMLANPYPVAKNLNDLISTNDGAYANWSDAAADEIYTWNGAGYDPYFLNDNGWGDTNVNWKWSYMDGGWPAPATNLIQPAQGFWYNSRAGSFTWDEPKPYSYP